LQAVATHVRNDLQTHLAWLIVALVALQQPHDGDLTSDATLATFEHASFPVLVHVTTATTDEGFVSFNVPAELAAAGILHGESNAVQHEPCGLLSDADSFGEFVATDAVLAIGDQPYRNQPLVDAEWRIFHDAADLHGELPPLVIGLALPDVTRLSEVEVSAPASGALGHAIRPAELHHFRKGNVGIREVDDGFLEGFGPVVQCHAHSLEIQLTCVK